ncbi:MULTISPECIES: terminase large subunit domain-containing protein [Halomonas]|uniref:terminase large subunit domain-containing protein n=1 Tax=Halomonas TaxID=2745 RepID=UPI001C93B7CE|nr:MULTISPECIES: terminase family protein [Halomonas]MBY6206875.1 terminase family protein [Halomonas sp. DP3Y7-2]MBY6230349.1 terminase family protein [Halomonas sp. DP3Y7-1]MCA0918510.1 terminase family protein [Halomonas denitrificans]
MTTMPPDLTESPRLTARHLYWQGWRVARIAEYIGEKPATVHSWKSRDNWDAAAPIERVEQTLEARMVQLIAKPDKEGKDYKEIDLLGRQFERLARVRKYEQTGREADLNPNIEARNEAPRKRKPRRNHLDEEQVEALKAAFLDSLFDYQVEWHDAGQKHRIRNILKSRQIGATWYFAREAIVDAFESGRNKIFLSASKAQAHIFKNYIIQFVKEITDVDLKGDPIVLDNGAELHFLGTNSKTAQGYHGDTYLDEYFWIHRFAEFRKVTSGMAMHKKWRQTYFSTPSSLGHEAYPFWSGEMFNKRRKKSERHEFDVSHAALARGMVCPDGQWRQIVTVEDAIAGGCDLFDLEQLRLEYSDEEFANLLMCQFVDDSQSAFPLSLVHPCMVDSWEVWGDYRPHAPRPVGDRGVWLGYDPTGTGEDGDGAGLVVVLPARHADERHRVLERHRLKGEDYEAQADFIKGFRDRYRIEHIGIDITGLGEAVAEHVAKWFPTLTRFRYDPAVKGRLVMQAQQIMRRGRLEFDVGWMDLAQSFMAIKKELTASGRQYTYTSGRSKATGHADLAWATMHALSHEPIDGPAEGTGQSLVEIYE